MNRTPTLIDTGPLVAIFDKNHSQHQSCLEVFSALPAPLLTTWPVITEAAYLLREWSNERRGLFTLLRTEAIRLVPIERGDVDAIETILETYADQKFQLADATLMHVANRDGITQVLTLDRKDFNVFRTASGSHLTLLPEFG